MVETLRLDGTPPETGGLGIISSGSEDESAKLVLLPSLLAGVEEKVVRGTSSFAVPPPTAAMNSLRRARSAFTLSPSSSPDQRISSSTSSFASSKSSTSSNAAGESFFSWSRWYGSSQAAPSPSSAAHDPSPPPTDDISRLVRAALRRSRAAEESSESLSASTSSSADSNLLLSPAISLETEEGDRLTLSPASSSGGFEWPWDILPAGHDAGCGSVSETEASSLASSTSSKHSPRLRAAQSAATLRARPPPPTTGRLLKRVSSQISLTTDAAEVAPHSPSSPSLGAFPSPTFSAGFSASTSSSYFPSPAPFSPVETPPSALSLSTRLRRAASSATLRSINPFRLSSSSPSSSSSPIPPLPDSSTSTSDSNPAPPPPALGASTLLRDLLLRHDSLVDPPPLPSTFSSPESSSPHNSDDEDEEDEDEREDAEVAASLLAHNNPPSPSSVPFYTHSSSSGTWRVPTGTGNESDDPTSYSFSTTTTTTSDSDADPDDPFSSFSATAARHASMAWMSAAPSSDSSVTAIAGPEGEGEDPFADADSDTLPPDSPSLSFPPFDPFAFSSSSSSTTTLPPVLPPSARPRPTRVLTKQRSFVDPRTRKLRTAPGVVVTPSTPERERTWGRSSVGEMG